MPRSKGLLKPGGTIIEGTSGNTGMGLALVAAVRGYKMVFTITDKQSKEKVDLLKALGAEVIVCPTAVEPDDPRSYYSVAKKLAREIPNSFYPNQYDNPMNPAAHYETTGPEIWEDTEGKITHFVCGMGTGGTISGAGKYLKEKNPAIQIIGVDPEGSLYYEFHKTGQVGKARTYVVEGIGEDFFPTTMNMKILDDVIQVNDEECFVVARRLVKQEGIFTGGSGGGCLSAALRLAKNLDEKAFIVAFMPDTGMRYLSKVYNEEWMRERGYVDSAVAITAGEVVNAKHKAGKVRELVIVRPYQTVFHALKTMQEQDISQIPVFEENLPIGTVYEDQILILGAARQRSSQTGHSRSDEQAAAENSQVRSRRARHLHSEPRKSRGLRRDGRNPFRNPHQIRFDEHRRQSHGTKALSASRSPKFTFQADLNVRILDFNERLKDSILIADGAMGSMLHEAVGAQRCFDELNSTEPEAVFRVHQAYIEAGAQIIETNTFGANRFKLAHLGLGDEVQRLNSRGVKIAREAREAAAREVLIAGSMGPLGLGVQARHPEPQRNHFLFPRTGASAGRTRRRSLHSRNIHLHRRNSSRH